MFALFKKAASDDSMGEDSAMLASKSIVKVGGHEFMPGDPASLKSFDIWQSKVQASNDLIPTGDGTTYVPANSMLGKAELLKAELQLKHGADPQQAQRAVDQLPAMKATATKPVIIYKTKPISDAAPESTPEPTVVKGSAKASTAKAQQSYRGPGGPK